MILNRGKQFLLAIVALLTFLNSCIDVPSNSPPLPNYRALVKYFNVGSGRDTIAYIISSVADTKKDSSKVYTMSGTDSVYTVTYITKAMTVDRYRRFDVNFLQSYNVFVDGSLLATLPSGSATNYFDTPAGSRKIELRGTGTALDSIRITKIDSAISITRDTIRNGVVVGKSKFDTTRNYYSLLSVPVPVAATPLTIDSAFLSFETERQRSVFMLGNPKNTYTVFKEQGQVRFGKINFRSMAERNVFEGNGTDSTALVRFVNGNADTTVSSLATMKTSVSTLATTLFSASSLNMSIRAKSDTTYRFIFTYGATTDTVSVVVSPRKQYSFVLFNETGVPKVKTFVH